MKRVIKRTTSVVLAIVVLCGTVGWSYQNVRAAGIVAGGAIVGTLEEILLSFGIFLLPSAMADQAQSSDWWYSEDGNAALKPYYDDLASEYEKERFKVINGGGGDPQPSPTPDAGNTPEPGVTPVPGEIPTFDELVAPALAGGAISWASGAWDTMAKAVGNLWDKIMESDEVVSNQENPFSYADLVGKVNTTYFYQGRKYTDRFFVYNSYHKIDHLYCQYIESSTFLRLDVLFYDQSNNKVVSDVFCYRTNNLTSNTYVWRSQSTCNSYFDSGYMPATINYDFYIPYTFNGVNYDGESKPLPKSSMWPSTDTKDDYNNNNSLPSPSYPNLAVPSITLPTLDEIKNLWKQGSDDEENRPTYVTNFITNHTVQPTPEPEPTKKPEVNPNPGGGTDPDPNPDPNPDPDPDNPDPDNPDPTPEEEASPYKADLREIFPFCIPFDLIHLFKVFDAEPEAPVFKFPLDLELDNPWTDEKVVDYHHEFEFDFSDYEDLIKLLRIIQIVAFITGLMMITRQQMIKG